MPRLYEAERTMLVRLPSPSPQTRLLEFNFKFNFAT